MTHFSDADIKKALVEISPDEKADIETWKFGEIKGSVEDSVREDVALLKASPLIKDSTQIIGLVWDINTGVLSEVTESKSEL
jgi:carbonic anhydrase